MMILCSTYCIVFDSVTKTSGAHYLAKMHSIVYCWVLLYEKYLHNLYVVINDKVFLKIEKNVNRCKNRRSGPRDPDKR